MKKRILALVLGACMAVSLVGCGKEISNDKITIKQYKGLEVETVEEIKVSDEEVEQSIQSTLQTIAKYNDITDRAVEKGDLVTMDYVGKVDGVEFEGGKAEGATLEIGSGQYIPGFEDKLIGHNTGETFDINVTFPENYNEELGGKDAVFTITLNKIQKVEIPELTDDILPELGTDAKTIKEYKAQVKEQLEKSNKETVESQREQNVWQALIDNCTVEKYDDKELEETIANIESEISYAASMYGMEPADFIQQYYGISIDEMAKNMLKQKYAIELIVKKEKIELSNDDLEKGIKELAEQYGYENPDDLEEEAGIDALKEMIIQKKVGKFLMDNAKFVKAKDTDKKDK